MEKELKKLQVQCTMKKKEIQGQKNRLSSLANQESIADLTNTLKAIERERKDLTK
jgi:hypothetical protein